MPLHFMSLYQDQERKSTAISVVQPPEFMDHFDQRLAQRRHRFEIQGVDGIHGRVIIGISVKRGVGNHDGPIPAAPERGMVG